MAPKRKRRKPRTLRRVQEAPVLERDPEAVQILLAMARIEDPMTRYLISMLIDRLTEQMARLLQSQEPAAEPAKDYPPKMN